MKAAFKIDQNIGISRFRFWLVKIFYATIIVLLGIEVWTKIFTQTDKWQPSAVAYSFWAAFSFLAILGVLHPLKMVSTTTGLICL